MSDISITLISHASVLIRANGIGILTDPWQFGRAFNDSWSLLIAPASLDEYLEGIDYLWVSHEHPDHFHIPTLNSLPEAFKKRVTVLFQASSDHQKMVNAFTKMLGFDSVRLMPHKTWLDLGDDVEVYCYHSRQLDSALAVRTPGQVVLNINDTEMSDEDILAVGRDLGPVDVVLNQFSIAGFEGDADRLDAEAAVIIDDMIRVHRGLDAKVTIPFASFVHFSREDNAFINPHANSIEDVVERFAGAGLDLAVLAPGDTFASGGRIDNDAAREYYDDLYSRIDRLPVESDESVPLSDIEAAFRKRLKKLREMHGLLALKLLRPVILAIPDLDERVELDFGRGTFRRGVAGEADLTILSQPLQFAFAHDFGLQTLGVSGRYRIHRNHGNWFRHRALMAMTNADIGLSMSKALRPQQLGYFWKRRSDLVHQIRHRVARAVR